VLPASDRALCGGGFFPKDSNQFWPNWRNRDTGQKPYFGPASLWRNAHTNKGKGDSFLPFEEIPRPQTFHWRQFANEAGLIKLWAAGKEGWPAWNFILVPTPENPPGLGKTIWLQDPFQT